MLYAATVCVGVHREVADREVVVTLGQRVLVEHDHLAGVLPGARTDRAAGRRPAAAVHAVLEALDRAGEVLVRPAAHRRGGVGLLHAPDDLVVELAPRPPGARARRAVYAFSASR